MPKIRRLKNKRARYYFRGRYYSFKKFLTLVSKASKDELLESLGGNLQHLRRRK